MTERAKHGFAAAAIVVAALAVFGPAFAKREVFVFRDHSDYFQPMRIYTAQHLRAGRLPLWNPYNASGEAWLANPQTAVFSPPAWLFLVLPFATAYVAYLFVHALLLGFGAYRLFSRGAPPLAALGGAIALMLCGPVVSLLDVSNNYTTFAWLPLLIVCALERRAIAGGVVLALTFLAGEPFLAAIAALIFVVIVRRVKVIAIAATLASSVSAIQLFPFVAMIVRSNRVGAFSAEEVLQSSMSSRDWMRALVPPRLHWIAPREQFVLIVYLGIFVLLLAIAGVVLLAREKRWSTLVGWGALFVVSAIIASGPRILTLIPLEIVRYPARLMPYCAFALVALAVVAWSRVAAKSVAISAALTLAVAVDLLIAIHPLLGTAPFTRGRVPYPQSIGHASKILQLYPPRLAAGGSRASWIAGYTNLFELRFAATTAAPLAPRRYDDLIAAANGNIELLRSIGVGAILSATPLRPPFEPVASAERIVVYRVPGVLPMAYVVTRDGKRLPPRALALDASSARVIADTPGGGMLVLTQNDEPGWSVRVDGRAARKTLALGAFRAVEIAPGRHEIAWKYRPLSFVVGAIVTLLTLIALVVAFIMALMTSR